MSYPNCETPPAPETVSSRSEFPVRKINSWLIPAILTTFCFCMPLGIAAICFASKVSGFAAKGDIAHAQSAAKKAKWLSIAGIASGIIAISFWLGTVLCQIILKEMDL